MRMSAKRALGLVLAGVLAAGPLIVCDGDGIATATADIKAEATTAAGDAKAGNDIATDATVADSGEKKALHVTMERVYAPYNWVQPDDSNGAVAIMDNNKFAYGYDVIMIKEIYGELDYDLEIVRLDWGSLISTVTAGRVGCVIVGQPTTSERLQVVDSTEPYYYTTIVALAKEGSRYANTESVADLAGATCISQQSIIWYDTCLPQTQGANILAATASAPDILMSLNADKCNLVVADQSTGRGVLIAYPNLKTIEFGGGDADFQVTDEDINIGISLKEGSTELKDAISNVLIKMTKDDFSKMMGETISVQSLVS